MDSLWTLLKSKKNLILRMTVLILLPCMLVSASSNSTNLRRRTGLFELLTASTTPIILYIKESEKVLLANYERYAHIKREFMRINKLPVPVLIVGANSMCSIYLLTISYLLFLQKLPRCRKLEGEKKVTALASSFLKRRHITLLC